MTIARSLPEKMSSFSPILLSALVFASFWAWQTGVNYAPISHLDSQVFKGFWYTGNVFVCAGYMFVAVFASKMQRIYMRRSYLIFSVVCQLVDTLLFIIPFPVGSSATPAWYAIYFSRGIFLMLGTVSYSVVLLNLLVSFGDSTDRDFIILAGTALSFLFYLVIDNLPLVASAVILLALPVLMFFIASVLDLFKDPDRSESTVPDKTNRMGMRILIAFFIFALSLNFIRRVISGNEANITFGSSTIISMTFVIIIAVTLIEVFGNRRGARNMPAYLLAVLITLAIFLHILDVDIAEFTYSLASASFFYFIAILWRLLADHVRLHLSCRMRIMATTYIAYTLGLLSGSLCYHAYSSYSSSLTTTMPLLIAYAVFVAGFFLLRTASAHDPGSELMKMLQIDVEGGDVGGVATMVKMDCALLSQGKGLTEREFEVLCQVASGKSMQGIADSMCVSANTVKTHAAHVYSKLGYHSREEILHAIEDIDRHRAELSQ